MLISYYCSEWSMVWIFEATHIFELALWQRLRLYVYRNSLAMINCVRIGHLFTLAYCWIICTKTESFFKIVNLGRVVGGPNGHDWLNKLLNSTQQILFNLSDCCTRCGSGWSSPIWSGGEPNVSRQVWTLLPLQNYVSLVGPHCPHCHCCLKEDFHLHLLQEEGANWTEQLLQPQPPLRLQHLLLQEVLLPFHGGNEAHPLRSLSLLQTFLSCWDYPDSDSVKWRTLQGLRERSLDLGQREGGGKVSHLRGVRDALSPRDDELCCYEWRFACRRDKGPESLDAFGGCVLSSSSRSRIVARRTDTLAFCLEEQERLLLLGMQRDESE